MGSNRANTLNIFGFGTYILGELEDEITIIILTNISRDMHSLTKRVLDIVDIQIE